MTRTLPGLIRERARAKVNLTLTIHGRRRDGYHVLTSLVAFAAVADDVTLDPAAPDEVRLTGPFAQAVIGEDIAARAVRLAQAAEPRLEAGRFEIVKTLPVAGGVGGGSADAAAVLRALRTANADLAASVPWARLAADLGADCPVCLADRTALMSGIGELVQPLCGVPVLPAVLANPQTAVPADKTRAVFRALGAGALASEPVAEAPPVFASRDDLLAWLARRPNDLEAASTAVMPDVGIVLDALRTLPGMRLARLSGAGPTAFALFDSAAAAAAAAASLAARHPTWWVRSTILGDEEPRS